MPTNRPVALLDVDGVLADFHRPTLDFVEREFGVRHSLSDFPTWDIIETVGRQHQPAIEAHWMTPGWCRDIPTYEGAVDGVGTLREVADVYFVTAQMTHSPYWMWERVQWLKEHFGADDKHVVFTLSKHLVRGDVLVDDKASNIAPWVAAHPDKQGVLWSQPFNRLETIPPRTLRCNVWGDVFRLL